jgi:autotransporter-associated beta strand protein
MPTWESRTMRASARTGVATLIRLGVALALLMAAGTSAARAQSAFWNTAATAGGSWSTASNWQGGIVPSGAGNSAGFILDFNPGASVTLDGSRTIGTVISSSANPWSIDPGTGGPLTVASVIVTGSGPLTMNAPLGGSTFTKDGSGTLVVSNPGGNYSGAININAGTLQLVGSGNYSPGGNVVTLASGATLDVTGLTAGLRFGGDPSTRLGVNDGDVLTGTGTVNGGLKVASGGTVYPGNTGVGALSVNGSGDFASGSVWKVKLGTANAGGANTSNRIDFTAILKLEGGVNIPVDGSGLTFAAGQTYQYVIATSNGNFDIGSVNFQPTNFNPPEFVTQERFSLTTSGDNLILQISAVPEPTFIVAVALAGAAGCGALRRLVVHRRPTGR